MHGALSRLRVPAFLRKVVCPTFRGNDGIWAKFKPEELANMNAFMRNPELVWEWYKARKKVIAEVEPNAGHCALAAMETDVSIVHHRHTEH